ncbi:hypothetical protein [Paenibacillus sp. QZ-Y1]|uniref:hypothetical protein n=1 Tax=Paenibacillus sp. QZ-Y1 TaxID=3414511 RepID=UPI003F7AED4E
MATNDKSLHKIGEINTKAISEGTINSLISRCQVSQIEYSSNEAGFVIKLNSGRGKYEIILESESDALDLLDKNFEEYTVLKNFVSICSYQHKTIEACIEHVYVQNNGIMNRKLFGEFQYTVSSEPIILSQVSDLGNVIIELSGVSKEISLIMKKDLRRNSPISLKIRGVNFNQHDKALEMLKRISDSLFFQIDLRFKLPLMLTKQNLLLIGGGAPRKANVSELKFPKLQYSSEAISLYWYARSARRMPLLQYLAFYQAIEFYFPIYTEIDAKKVLKKILKNPIFDGDNDGDLTKLITTIRPRLNGRGLANERTQLLSTLKECINSDDIRDFLKGPKKKEFFSLKNELGGQSKKLSLIPLTDQQSDDELINNLKDRIYDIRCKIVHTKSNETDQSNELILPFSKEADYLDFDIELIKLVAQQVIISSGSPLF